VTSSLEKKTINIGKKEWQGSIYIEISRAKALHGLVFQPPFPYDQYEKMGKCANVSNKKMISINMLYKSYSISSSYYLLMT
jgi:hypothetical protein